MMDPNFIVNTLKEALPGAEVPDLSDLTGTGDHWRLTIVAPQFESKNMVEQHRMVYEALNDCMEANGGGIHALSLATYAPDQWKRKK
jgi:stress-induced morphogen